MRIFTAILFSLAAACSAARPAWAQCSGSFNFTADGSQALIDNRTNGCIDFQLTYNASGASALSLLVQSAPDNAGVPGAWVTFVGTVVTGVNPNVATDQNYTLITGYNPWVRVTLSGLMGASARVRGTLKGSAASLSSGGTPFPQPAEVEGCDAAGAPPTCMPVLAGAFDGTNVQRLLTCTTRQAITLAAGTDVVIVPPVALKTTRLCSLVFAMDSAADVTIRQGTGTTCLTGTVALTGAFPALLAVDLFSPAAPLLDTLANVSTCAHFSTAVTVGGYAIYAQF